MTFWNELPYTISPYLIQFNGFGIRYYSLMYVLAFVTFYFLIRYRLKTEKFSIRVGTLDDFLVWAAAGVLLGGRLGYVIFYDLQYYLDHPFSIFMPFSFTNGFTFTGISGMSYHGGLIGVMAAVYGFSRKNNISLWEFSDLICPAVPLGYTFGRLGNFFNSELYGRATSMPWGMFFPSDPTHTLRHPSQLYEAFFEGIVLFCILWWVRKEACLRRRMFGLYLAGYGLIRFMIEFFREPDDHLKFVAYFLTMGQILCLIMIFAGVLILFKNKIGKGIEPCC
nr:prolipoprotein diacylglyceryl transferase [Desulfobacula sp.]